MLDAHPAVTDFLFQGETDDPLPPFVRVAGVSFEGESTAWSFDVLRRKRVIEAEVGGQPLVVLWDPGSASPPPSTAAR